MSEFDGLDVLDLVCLIGTTPSTDEQAAKTVRMIDEVAARFEAKN